MKILLLTVLFILLISRIKGTPSMLSKKIYMQKMQKAIDKQKESTNGKELNNTYKGVAILIVLFLELFLIIFYGKSLGRTEKFFKHSIAYKYEDELYETVLKDIEWGTSKTGLVNPVALFQPTIIDGAEVTRATLHNISYIENIMNIGSSSMIFV